MRSVNKVILIGNLTRDPELKNTSSGQSIVNFGLATNRQWSTSNGEKRSSAEFHECVAWAKLAEICDSHLKKGMLVYVEGYLKTRSWDREDGTRNYRTEVVLHDMIILEKRSDHMDDYDPDMSSDDDDDDSEETPKKETKSSTATPEMEVEVKTSDLDLNKSSDVTPAGEISADIDEDNLF